MKTSSPILLVEDNQNDEALTLRALKKNHIMNEVVVARDGAEALDYLFGTGAHAGRDLDTMPQVVLLDLNLPRVGGLDVLRRIRYSSGANAYVRKPVGFSEFTEAVKTLGLFWLLLNETAPQQRSPR
jgi:two-component system, response regulator